MTAEARPFDAADAEAFLLASADAREALEIPRGATLAVAPLARGEYHVNFVFAHPLTRARFVFRVNLGSQMHLDHQIRYEASALRLLARSGRTPGVLHVDDSGTFFGHGVLVEEFLPGRPLDYRCDLDEAARVLADIHSVVVPAEHGLVEPTNPLAAIASECAELFSAYRAWEGADANVVARIGGMLAAAEDLVRCEGARPSASGCHVINTELNARNFLIDRASARARGALIDWEKPIVGPVEQDLAHFLVPTTTFWATDVLLDAAEQRRFVEATSPRWAIASRATALKRASEPTPPSPACGASPGARWRTPPTSVASARRPTPTRGARYAPILPTTCWDSWNARTSGRRSFCVQVVSELFGLHGYRGSGGLGGGIVLF